MTGNAGWASTGGSSIQLPSKIKSDGDGGCIQGGVKAVSVRRWEEIVCFSFFKVFQHITAKGIA